MSTPRVAIVVGSTRPGRKAPAVARWVRDRAAGRTDATFEVVDLADQHLPLLDEPVPPAAGRYEKAATRSWADRVAAFDAFVFVTPEYNHGLPGALKNALDHVYAEWNDKVAGIVSYGVHGGVRAAEALRLVLGELQVADVRLQVALSLRSDFAADGSVAPAQQHVHDLHGLLDQVVRWSGAFRALRTDARHDGSGATRGAA